MANTITNQTEATVYECYFYVLPTLSRRRTESKLKTIPPSPEVVMNQNCRHRHFMFCHTLVANPVFGVNPHLKLNRFGGGGGGGVIHSVLR